ncbi:MAG: GNAT family N-acetyltransferase [bacterium]|nr:GNAT family N-acetyltransferase [bacterium]
MTGKTTGPVASLFSDLPKIFHRVCECNTNSPRQATDPGRVVIFSVSSPVTPYFVPMDLTYKIENRTVRAYDGDSAIGKLSVQNIDLHWVGGTPVLLAGIGGVGTDPSYRGLGVASKMMDLAKTFSRENGYACPGLTTNLGNNARRLYARSGYTLLFRPG